MEIRALCCNCFFGAHFVQVSPLRATARCTYPPLPTGKGEGLRAAGPDQCGRKRCRCWDGIRAPWLGVDISWKFRFFSPIFLFYTSKKKTNLSPQKGPFQKRNVVFQVFLKKTDMSVFGGSNVSRHLEPSLPTSKKKPDLEPPDCEFGMFRKVRETITSSMKHASSLRCFFFFGGCLVRHLPYLHGKNG